MTDSSLTVTILEREYNLRREKNPAYSKRAFASHIGIGSGRLSELFSKKRELKKTTALKLATNLSLSEEETLKWIESLDRKYRNKKTKVAKPAITNEQN